VRQVILGRLLGCEPDLSTVARELGMSTRTLQRRLKEERTTLNEVVGIRRDLSTRYLRQPDLTISDVAYLLGFAEPSTFHRAFRKWSGLTPGEFRKSR